MSESHDSALPTTQLRDYYKALHALKEHEQTALAEAHAEDPKLLAYRFRLGLEALESESPITDPFYPPGRKDPPDPPTPVAELKSTIGFASQLSDRRPHPVGGNPALGFRYVDREISPLRTTERAPITRRSLDLLLANDNDDTPIFAELKIGSDKPTYFAFVQALMLATELLAPAQRARLSEHPPAADLAWPDEGPFADLYIVAFKPPKAGKYRARSFKATEKISKRLVEDPDFSSHIRRIAYLEASAANGELRFEKRFAFGPDV